MKLRLIAATALAAATIAGTPGTATAAATPPPAVYYGMHYAHVADGTWPEAKVGAIRLHDTGTAWHNVQPAPGVFDWSRLDAAVTNAESHGADITLVLGGTPAWAATDPHSDAGQYPAGSNSPPANLDNWWVYVHAVATRYAGRIGSYEPVNEPNVPIFWNGSHAQLALMARVAKAAVKSADSGALMVSPSVVLRGDWQGFIRGYRAAGGYRWADVVGVHCYPLGGVAQAMRVYDRMHALMREMRLRRGMPLWDTETNLEVGTGRYVGTDHRQAEMLARYYREAWRHGVARVYFYDWSHTDWLGVRMTVPGSTAPSAAGLAFTAVQGAVFR
jgi:hypothetical protein